MNRLASAALAALALVVSLAACGGSTAPRTSPGPASVTAPVTAKAPDTPAPVSTPRPPSPLSREPVIAPPAGSPRSRLVIRNLIRGTGAVARPHDSVTVNYVGALYKGGRVFDASWNRHRTVTVDLANGSVMSGWVAGIRGERVGGRRQLIVPPSLAYGTSGNPPAVPPNSTLIFDVDLLSVARAGDDH